VQPGYLTGSGMRQRFLLGDFNRQRYLNLYNLLDEDYNPNQIYAQSTDVLRVIMSTYAEFMGLYPPKQQSPLTEKPISSKADPAIKIRRSNHVKAVIDGYVMLPVFSYLPSSY